MQPHTILQPASHLGAPFDLLAPTTASAFPGTRETPSLVPPMLVLEVQVSSVVMVPGSSMLVVVVVVVVAVVAVALVLVVVVVVVALVVAAV